MTFNVSSTTNTYFDGDGLLRRYGTAKAIASTSGEYKTVGSLREIELRIDLTKLTSTSKILISEVNTFMPKNVYIEQVVLEVMTAATSAGSPTLDVGLIGTDGSTAITPTTSSWTTDSVFIAAEVLSGKLDTLGTKVTYTAGVSKAGGGIGLAPGQVAYITARANTATFTAGTVAVKINYRAFNA